MCIKLNITVMEHIIFPLVNDFFIKLGIVVTSVWVDQVWEDINIRVETPDSAILIGIHGKNIETFQYLLSRMIERKLDSHIHVHLEVNDYMKQKEEKLYAFLETKITKIISTGESIQLPNLTPYERKKAHGYIAEKQVAWLKTQSTWEWLERILVLSYTWERKNTPISPAKTQKIPAIDLISDDGVGI